MQQWLINREYYSSIVYEITKEIDNLKPGEFFFLPGGYNHPRGGHAIFYEIRCEEIGKYSLKVVNTGEGAPASSFELIKALYSKSQCVKPRCYTELSRDALCDLTFLENLTRIQIDMNDSHNMKLVHQIIEDHLVKNHKAVKKEGAEIHLQGMLSCPFSSVRAAIQPHLSEDLLLPFELYMMRKGREYFRKEQERDRNQGRIRRLIFSLLNSVAVETFQLRKRRVREVISKFDKSVKEKEEQKSLAKKQLASLGWLQKCLGYQRSLVKKIEFLSLDLFRLKSKGCQLKTMRAFS